MSTLANGFGLALGLGVDFGFGSGAADWEGCVVLAPGNTYSSTIPGECATAQKHCPKILLIKVFLSICSSTVCRVWVASTQASGVNSSFQHAGSHCPSYPTSSAKHHHHPPSSSSLHYVTTLHPKPRTPHQHNTTNTRNHNSSTPAPALL